MRYLSIISFLILCSCNDTIEKNSLSPDLKDQSIVAKIIADTLAQEDVSINEIDGFTNMYNHLTNSINVKSSLDDFFEPNLGLYVISSNGAMPSVKHIYTTDEFFFLPALKLFQTQSLDKLTADPIFQELPNIICDEKPYDKEGCFAAETNPLLESQVWNFANLNEKEIQAIESLTETVKITVVNTHNFTFFFSFINEKWYLTFIDVRIPCSA